MTRISRTTLAAPILGLGALVLAATPAGAADGSAQGTLSPVPLSGVEGSGQAMIEIEGDTLTFMVAADGLLANAPHAAHLHFGASATHTCPSADADTDGNGQLNTTEGAPSYGGIVVSLTQSGDTSPESGWAVDRFANGPSLEYMRGEVRVSEEVASAIAWGQSVVVVNGVDYNGNGMYDRAGGGPSDLMPSLPAEATNPALCGVMNASQMAMPTGGVATGGGSTDAAENRGLIGAGAAAALVGTIAMASILVSRRRTATDPD